MSSHIVMVPVVLKVGRWGLENIEGKTFESTEEVLEHFSPDPVEVYTLSEFVDMCNNEEILLDASWITHITVKGKDK